MQNEKCIGGVFSGSLTSNSKQSSKCFLFNLDTELVINARKDKSYIATNAVLKRDNICEFGQSALQIRYDGNKNQYICESYPYDACYIIPEDEDVNQFTGLKEVSFVADVIEIWYIK